MDQVALRVAKIAEELRISAPKPVKTMATRGNVYTKVIVASRVDVNCGRGELRAGATAKISIGKARFLLWFSYVDRKSVLGQFETLLPLAAEWAAEEEARILREGVPLAEQEIIDAKAIGVREPERVRLLQVDTIPTPRHPILKAATGAIRFLTSAPRGLTLGHGIFVRSDCWRDRSLVAHELVHTAQYERLGGILPFLRKYLFECVTFGYPDASLDQDGLSVVTRICVD